MPCLRRSPMRVRGRLVPPPAAPPTLAGKGGGTVAHGRLPMPCAIVLLRSLLGALLPIDQGSPRFHPSLTRGRMGLHTLLVPVCS